jgi:hypothetical protein
MADGAISELSIVVATLAIDLFKLVEAIIVAHCLAQYVRELDRS